MDTAVVDERVSSFEAKCEKQIKTLIAHQEFWREALSRGIEIPYDAYYGTSHYANIAQHLEYDSELESSPLDVEATQKQIARIIRWARSNGWSVEKKYNDDEFTVRIEGIHEPICYMEFFSTRQVVCKKVQTGTKTVEAVEAHEEPVYEYVCDKVAFLSID